MIVKGKLNRTNPRSLLFYLIDLFLNFHWPYIHKRDPVYRLRRSIRLVMSDFGDELLLKVVPDIRKISTTDDTWAL